MDPRLLDRKTHHDALALLAARALQAGDSQTAFLLADRRCRVRPFAGPEHFALRAEAAWRLGYEELAIDALRAALEDDPLYLEANKRMLLWGADDEKLKAAHALLNATADLSMAAAALRALAQCPEQMYVCAASCGTGIGGWGAWRDENSPVLRLVWDHESMEFTLRSDPRHPLASVMGNAAAWCLDWPDGVSEIALDTPGIRSFIAGSPLLAPRPHATKASGAASPRSLPVTIIIPIYADFAATKACLDSVLTTAQLPDWMRVVVVDDATPEPAIAEMLDALAGRGLIALIRNERNLGFVGSINRALQAIPDGDIVLLNSDTIVPLQFAERLRAAAHSAPDIATVTPLSNNGEPTSFPVPFRSNPLPDRETIFRLDGIAAEVNAGEVVTIPNGVGFCLYIRRDCLAQIGPLSVGVRRGYLEDVELCLRARRYGLRNVCATSVYVGHAGARSFRDEKRALVVRNLKSLDSQYPRYGTEYAAFMAFDPLRPARNALQSACPTTRGGDLLICGAGPARDITWARAKALASAGTRAVVAELSWNGGSPKVVLSDATGQLPQRLQFAIGSGRPAQLLDYIAKQGFNRMEITDPPAVPVDLAGELVASGIPLDFFVANGGLHCPRQTLSVERSRHCGIPTDPKLCDLCISRLGGPAHLKTDVAPWRQEWRVALEKCRTVWVPDADAAAFFKRMFPDLSDRVRMCSEEIGRTARWAAGGLRLGLLPLDQTSTEVEFVVSLARAFRTIGSNVELMVLGQTFDDLRVMACANAFVSGTVEPREIASLLAAFGVGGILVGAGTALFGHPMTAAARSSGVPIARFCWSRKQLLADQDLRLDLLAPFEDLARVLDQWLAGLRRGPGAVT
jgi:GT2 family glycosyltransferase